MVVGEPLRDWTSAFFLGRLLEALSVPIKELLQGVCIRIEARHESPAYEVAVRCREDCRTEGTKSTDCTRRESQSSNWIRPGAATYKRPCRQQRFQANKCRGSEFKHVSPMTSIQLDLPQGAYLSSPAKVVSLLFVLNSFLPLSLLLGPRCAPPSRDSGPLPLSTLLLLHLLWAPSSDVNHSRRCATRARAPPE